VQARNWLGLGAAGLLERRLSNGSGFPRVIAILPIKGHACIAKNELHEIRETGCGI
jgi:hypothetical protein